MITVFVVNDSLCLSPQEGSSSIKHVARGPQLEQEQSGLLEGLQRGKILSFIEILSKSEVFVMV